MAARISIFWITNINDCHAKLASDSDQCGFEDLYNTDPKLNLDLV